MKFEKKATQKDLSAKRENRREGDRECKTNNSMPRERIRRGHDVYTHLQNFTFLFTRFLLQFTLALI